MSNWIHRWLNPHCPDCIQEKVCNSCETLHLELARLREENKLLLEKILHTPEKIPDKKVAEPMKSVPRFVPWNVRRQMLEQEDREKAKLLKNVPIPDNSVEELEKELNIAEQNREKENG